jgi:hypothetical protein
VDSKLVSIVLRLVEKSPVDRYQRARRVANVLGAYLGMPSVTNESVPPARATDTEEPATGEIQTSPKESGWVMAILGVGALGALVFAGVLIKQKPTSSANDVASASPPAMSGAAAPRNQRVEALLARAFIGDRAAIAALEERPLASRSAREWLALGRGYAKNAALDKAMHAYGVALSKDRALAQDPQIAQTAASATRDPKLAPAALRLSADYLEAVGADLLYEVWVRDRARTPTSELAEELVKSDEVRAHASPALEVALTLRDAADCDSIAKLLPRVTLHGDRRSLRPLSALERRKDCKIPPATLAAAVSAVRERASPTF